MADPSPSAAPVPPRDAPAEGEGPPAWVRGALVASFLAVATLGVVRVHGRVRGLDDFRVDLSVAWLDGAPAWLPATERRALAEAAASTGTVSIYEEGLPEFAAVRLEADARVFRVLEARRRHPDALEVLVELRRPVALVEAGGRLLAADREGVLVPGDYRRAPLPRIRGGGAEVPGPGRPFGRAVKEGASVAAALPGDLAASLGLAVIDVSGVPEGTGVVLHRKATKKEAAVSVEWGRAPASPEAALDPPAPAKVARLRLAAERFPGLRGLRTVRLGFDDLVVVPL